MDSVACWEFFPGACLADEDEKNGVPVLLAVMHHTSACSSGHLLMLLDSCLQILFGSDSPLKISLASHLSLAPIFLLQGSLDSPNLRTHSFFWPFLAGWPMWAINLSRLSLYILLPKPGSQKDWPQTIEFYELLGWLLPWKFGINIYNRFPSSFSLGWGIEVYMTKKLPS